MDEQGEFEFVIATGIDITERRRMERAAQESQQQLEIAVARKKKDIAARLATISEMNHQIRNALHLIRFYSSVADDKGIPALEEAVNRIASALREASEALLSPVQQ